MKKINLLLAAVLFTVILNAQTILSHSTSQEVVTGSLRCGNDELDEITDFYWRSYMPSDMGITTDVEILGVQFGVNFNQDDPTLTSKDVVVKIYTSDMVFPEGTFTEIASKDVTISVDDTLTLLDVFFDNPITVAASTEVIIQVDILTETGVETVTLGANDLGEDSPSYLSSTCGGIDNPTPITDLLPPVIMIHYVLNLIVNEATAAVEDNNLTNVSVYPNPTKDILNVDFTEYTGVKANIYNLLGKDMNIIMNNEGQIDISKLSVGIYILTLETNEGSYTTKIVKQ